MTCTARESGRIVFPYVKASRTTFKMVRLFFLIAAEGLIRSDKAIFPEPPNNKRGYYAHAPMHKPGKDFFLKLETAQSTMWKKKKVYFFIVTHQDF